MADSRPRLDAPLTLAAGKTLGNRIVKSAMSEALADRRNDPSDGQIDLYARWSKGGAAMLITGNMMIDRRHLEHAGNVVLDEHSDPRRAHTLAAAMKSGGALALAQISHPGRQQSTQQYDPPALATSPLSISDVRLDLPGYRQPRAATEADLESVVGKFARTASLAGAGGFDGVQIHSAHGYLLSSSLSPRINTRTDRWGGSRENNARLLRSVVRAVRRAVGRDFIVAVKLNSADFQKGGFSHEDSIDAARMLQDQGVDFLEISGGNFEQPMAYRHAKKSTIQREAYFLEYARAIKAALHIPLMVTGGFRSCAVMQAALSEGATDLIGMGRPFVIDPEFPRKLLRGEIQAAPAVERDFPPAESLPPGAALDWFCHQLALRGSQGAPDLSLSVPQGHERYQRQVRDNAIRLMKARGSA